MRKRIQALIKTKRDEEEKDGDSDRLFRYIRRSCICLIELKSGMITRSPFVPTCHEVVSSFLKLAEVKSTDIVCDIG